MNDIPLEILEKIVDFANLDNETLFQLKTVNNAFYEICSTLIDKSRYYYFVGTMENIMYLSDHNPRNIFYDRVPEYYSIMTNPVNLKLNRCEGKLNFDSSDLKSLLVRDTVFDPIKVDKLEFLELSFEKSINFTDLFLNLPLNLTTLIVHGKVSIPSDLFNLPKLTNIVIFDEVEITTIKGDVKEDILVSPSIKNIDVRNRCLDEFMFQNGHSAVFTGVTDRTNYLIQSIEI